MNTGAKLITIAALGLASFATLAAPVSASPTVCTASNWKITGAIPSALYNSPDAVPSLGTPITATSCAGVFSGNEGPLLNPSPNLGYLNDGLLNGQGGLLSPTQFIDPSQLLALRDPNVAEDPGWIMLGILEANAGTLDYSDVTPQGGTPFSLGNVLQYMQTQTTTVGGTWQLTVDPNIIAIFAANNLFSRSNFDHLAFSVKSSKGWAVYDFDFTQMGDMFDLGIPYTLTGTWNMGDFMNPAGNNQQDISHISVWARDPITPLNEVPEPAGLALFGAGLLALCTFRRRPR